MEYKYYQMGYSCTKTPPELYDFYRRYPNDYYDWWDEEMESWEGVEGSKFEKLIEWKEVGWILEEISPLLILLSLGRKVFQ